METIDAVMIIETEENPELDTYLEAWACLIKSRLVWSLQGFYGRTAKSLIDRGIVSNDGTINWDTVNELVQLSRVRLYNLTLDKLL